MAQSLSREQSKNLTRAQLDTLFHACMEAGQTLEPNGVLDAMLGYLAAVYVQAGWDPTELPDDVEEYLSAEGYFESDDSTESTSGVPGADDERVGDERGESG